MTGIKDTPPGGATGDHVQTWAQDWRELRGDSDIQFTDVPMPATPPPPETPDWLARFLHWLGEVLSPVGEGMVTSWPVLKWVLLALGIALALYTAWRVFGPDLASRPGRTRSEGEWQPNQQAALALLEEADRFAAEGRYDEAAHLLLQRSVAQIAQARPDLIEPSSTAREIAAQPALPLAARSAFGVMAEQVERSLFALRRLSADDWQVARAAYAEFALAQKGLHA